MTATQSVCLPQMLYDLLEFQSNGHFDHSLDTSARMLLLNTIAEILDDFDVAVLDQWGVLHNGSVCYPDAAATMERLAEAGKKIVVLSNSGKRANANLDRLRNMGLPTSSIFKVVTSGETLWDDLHDGRLQIGDKSPVALYPICSHASDPHTWLDNGEAATISDSLHKADGILLMGLSDSAGQGEFDGVLDSALARQLPLVCSNPDKSSPRAAGLVASPGALADKYQRAGGEVIWYGKPHRSIYEAVAREFPDLPPERFLMVGDSIEHDIAGAHLVNFQSLLIRGGIYESEFQESTNVVERCGELCSRYNVSPPDYTLEWLK